MDLHIKDTIFIVTGASSGLGNAVAKQLLSEGARIIACARREDMLNKLSQEYKGKVQTVVGDVLDPTTIEKLVSLASEKPLHGVFVNAGGPPAKSIIETSMADWDEAYKLIMQWKVNLVKQLLPQFIKQQYGRILFSESSSVKQPIENLVLSNAFRLGMVGFAKTLSAEIADKGITVNVIGPGYHQTQAIDRIVKKMSETKNISLEEATNQLKSSIKVGHIGDVADFASMAAWLLSPLANYVTGNTITLDGGVVRSSL